MRFCGDDSTVYRMACSCQEWVPKFETAKSQWEVKEASRYLAPLEELKSESEDINSFFT